MNATSEFLHPERLWWLLAIPFVLLFVSAVLPRRRPTIARLASVALRSILLGLPVFVLAGPEVVTRAPASPRLDVLVDGSRSVSADARAQALEKVRLWSRGGEVRTRVVSFGAAPRVMTGWEGGPETAPASRRAADGDLASDPNPAVALLRLLDPGAPPAPVVMFTDGAVEPPLPFVEAGARGAAFVVPAAAAGGANVRLDEVRAVRDQATPGETVLELQGSASAAASGVVRVLVDGREVRSQPVELAAGPVRTTVSAGAIPPGRHVVCAWWDGSDAEPLDDEIGVVVDVPSPPSILLVAPEGRSLISGALKAQGIDHDVVTPPDVVQTPALLDRAQVLVLDRMAVEPLSTPEVVGRISSLLVRGGGVLFVPRDAPGELVAAEGRKFLDLLPFAGRPLDPKKKEDPPPEKPPPEKEGLKPPEPEKKKVERRPAPTLAILLVIDASGSMRGQSLRLAKEAAIKTAEVLHPEDLIGVIAFNDVPTQIVPMTKAGNYEDIEEKISRLTAGGRTDFGPALDEAREVFRKETAQIKHCIFLTDGHNNWPGAILARVETMAREGITLSTVGAGLDVDVNQLSEMAARGRGKYLPAYSAEQIPQIITIEAERMVTSSGARRPFEITAKADEPPTLPPPAPPKPDPPKETLPPEEAPRIATPLRAGWPAAYLKGVHPELAQGIFEWHRVDALPHAWVAVTTKGGDPIAVHTYAGFGRLVALTVPMQGDAAGPLVNWDDYSNFTSQVVRFLTPATRPERLQLRIDAAGRAARIEVVDVERKAGTDEKIEFEFRDQRARPVAARVRKAGPGLFDLEVPAGSTAVLLDVAATVAGEAGSGSGSCALGRPPEVARAGTDLDGLKRWSQALHGEVSARAPDAPAAAGSETVERRPASLLWLALMLPLFLLDLALKRAVPGSFP